MPAPQPPAPARRWTVDEVHALQEEAPPGVRYELVDGELLVTSAPRLLHQRAVGLLMRALAAYVEAHRLGEAFISPADIGLRPNTIVQPDVFVVPARGESPATSWAEVDALLLVVEVLSPSSARHDRFRKRAFYQRVGVPEYWVVDLDARAVERWHPDDERAELLGERLEWHPAGANEPFVLDLVALFTRVHGSAAPED